MKIATGFSTMRVADAAAREAFGQLAAALGGPPSLIVAYASAEYDIGDLRSALLTLAPGVPIHGATSCQGAMTTHGFHSADGVGLALWAIADETGDYGVGVERIGDDAAAAGSAAVLAGIAAAGRDGEPPALVWLSSVPGYEEAVIEGIQAAIGPNVPIAGGSAADNDVAGGWSQFTASGHFHDAVVAVAMYPSGRVHLAFHSGYTPTAHTGRVTRAAGRTLFEIDDRPAALVYDAWTGGAIPALRQPGNVLADTSLFPLGREVTQTGTATTYRLAHPETVTAEGALTLFANIEAGETVTLMAGTERSLVERAGRVARAAMDNGQLALERCAGALVVYCAGCMLTVQSEMAEVAANVNAALGGRPFIGTFTFGEQGCFISGENYHGNLMISVVVFEATS